MAVIAVSLTWYKMFYWMRLFNSTAFFINLLVKTFEDINFKAFMIMMIILMLWFGNVM